MPGRKKKPKQPECIFHQTGNREIKDYVQITAVDVGHINLCIRIERRYIYTGIIEPLAFAKYNITTSPQCYSNAINVFDKHLEYIQGSHLIAVERQLAKNYIATRLFQHLLTYFIMRTNYLKIFPSVMDVDAKIKSNGFGVGKIPDPKVWCVGKALELLRSRNDHASEAIMMRTKKRDDYADVVCYCEVLCYKFGYPKTGECLPIPITIPKIKLFNPPTLKIVYIDNKKSE
jgi:hypothetical protein